MHVCDGNTKHNLELRKAKACSKFTSLMDVWTDKRLNATLKLNLYRSLVVSTFVYGHEAWLLHKGLSCPWLLYYHRNARQG